MPEGTPALRRESQEPYKTFHSGSERLLRKTTTLEIIERMAPRTRSAINLRGKSTVHRKAMFFMELLWEHGYRKLIHWRTLDSYVEMFLGGFRQTKQFYLGRMKVIGRGVGNKVSVWIPGFLEKLHYVERKGEFWLLNHEMVSLPYHYVESLHEFVEEKGADEFQHNEGLERFDSVKKISLTVCSNGVGCGEAEKGDTAPTENNKQQQHNLRERNFQPRENESNRSVENSVSVLWLTELEKAQIMERDRKRLEILNRELLPWLQKTVKNRGETP